MVDVSREQPKIKKWTLQTRFSWLYSCEDNEKCNSRAPMVSTVLEPKRHNGYTQNDTSLCSDCNLLM